MLLGKELLMLLAGYALGCFTAGYYVVRLCTGQDIRTCGSGSTGARNVGRVLGIRGAAITFLADLTKGAVAVWAARSLGLDQWVVTLVMLSVVLGHIWPAQLQFSGGKGVATVFGAGIAFDWQLVLVLFVICSLSFVSTRRFTLSGLLAIAAAPLVAIALNYSLIIVFMMSLIVLLIFFAHRSNLHAILREMSVRGKPEGRKPI